MLEVILLVSGALALTCPTITSCSSLSDVCATIEASQITLGSCKGTYQCNLADISYAYAQGRPTVPCAVTPRASFSIGEGARSKLAEQLCSLKNQTISRTHGASHPILCNSDEDCRVISGSPGFCKCGLNGRAYCLYEKGDDEYFELYDYACDNELEMMMYQTLKIHLHPAEVGLASCAEDLFVDFRLMQNLTMGLTYFSQFDDLSANWLGAAFGLVLLLSV